MATYNYVCDNCKTDQDEDHSMNDKPKIICGKCKNEMRRNWMASPVIFKGSDWATNANRDIVQNVHPAAYEAHKQGKI